MLHPEPCPEQLSASLPPDNTFSIGSEALEAALGLLISLDLNSDSVLAPTLALARPLSSMPTLALPWLQAVYHGAGLALYFVSAYVIPCSARVVAHKAGRGCRHTYHTLSPGRGCRQFEHSPDCTDKPRLSLP